MPVLTISMENSPGIITDLPAHELPPEAWSGGQNVRVLKSHVARRVADVGFLLDANFAPGAAWFILPINKSPEYYWLAASGIKVGVSSIENYVTTWPDITRAAGNYNATELEKWTGGVIGGIPFLSNPNDEPQAWSPVITTQKLQNFSAITDWVSGDRCKSMRSFKQFLIAVNMTQGGTNYPRKVKWSAAADPNTLPGIWDITDKTKEAGETELAETDDACVDCLTLGDINIIYKEYSAYTMQHIGGAFIFRFRKLPYEVGMLAPGCAVEIPGGRHFVVTNDDIIVHNGVSALSVANNKIKKDFFSDLNSAYRATVSVVVDLNRKEVIIFYPSGTKIKAGAKYVWNWETGGWGKEQPRGSSGWFSAAFGVVSALNSPADPTIRAVVGALDGNPQFFYELREMDSPQAVDGIAWGATLEREGLALVGQDRQGKLTTDPAARKFLRAIWPKLKCTSGKTVDVYVGMQETLNEAVTWQGPYAFDPETDTRIDVSISGRFLAIKFQTTSTNIWWELYGYELDLEVIGKE